MGLPSVSDATPTFSVPRHVLLTLLENDVELVINDALLYNPAGTQFHKDAIPIQKESGPIVNTRQKLVTVRDLPSSSNFERRSEG